MPWMIWPGSRSRYAPRQRVVNISVSPVYWKLLVNVRAEPFRGFAISRRLVLWQTALPSFVWVVLSFSSLLFFFFFHSAYVSASHVAAWKGQCCRSKRYRFGSFRTSNFANCALPRPFNVHLSPLSYRLLVEPTSLVDVRPLSSKFVTVVIHVSP